MVTPASDGCYYPLQNGIVADPSNYQVSKAAAGSVALTGISSTATFLPGQAVLVRGGKSNVVAALGSDSGWSAASPSAFSQDPASHTKGIASARFDVDPSFVMGQEVGRFDFPGSQDWSSYDEIRFDGRCAPISNFKSFPPGGLVVVVRDSLGNVVSRIGADTNFGPSGGFIRIMVPLDQLKPLADVVSFSLAVDRANDAANRVHSLAVLDQSGPISSTGVGFTLWIDNVCLTADLHTTVASVDFSTSLTLTDPLGAALPDTNLGSTPMLFHDDAPALQAFLDAVPDFSEIVFPTGCKIPCASTILLRGRQGLKCTGRGGAGSSFANKSFGVPYFFYMGRAGKDFFQIDRSRGLWFEGLAWFCNGPMPPAAAVDLDQLGPSSLGITTDCRFDRCYVQGPLGYAPFCGFSISRVSRGNCEFIRFRDVWVNTSGSYPGVGVGFYIGGSSNAKSILFDCCSTGNGTVGWRNDGGNFVARSCSADYNGVDFVSYGSGEPIIIESFNGEFAGGSFFLNGTYGAIVSSCRWSSLIAGSGAPGSQAGAFKFGTASGAYQLLDNKVSPQQIVTNPVLVDPGSIGGQLLSRGNNYAYPQTSGNLWVLNGGGLSEGDVWASGGLSANGEVLHRRKVYGGDDAHTPRHLIGRGTAGRTAHASLNQTSLDEGGTGTVLGGWLEVHGGLHLKRTLVTADVDFTAGNTVKDQTPGIILVDASLSPVTITISNPDDYRVSGGQVASPLWWLRRIDASANVVRVAPFSRGKLVEGMDSQGYVYLQPGGVLRLLSDGAQNAKYWMI